MTSVEVRFYPEYRQYYSLYNDGGSINDIEAAEDRMVSVLSRELTYCGYRQIISTLLFVVFGGFIMDILPLGMMDLGKGIFRTLCVGYGLYAIANAMMLILLYFEDYVGSVTATGAFALVANALTIWQAARGDTAYFGAGFMAGAIVYFLIAFVRLEWSTRRLPYLLLGRQARCRVADCRLLYPSGEQAYPDRQTRHPASFAARIAVPRGRRKKSGSSRGDDDRLIHGQ